MSRTGWLLRQVATAADLLFPPQCAFCRQELPDEPGDKTLCGDCRAALLDETQPACARCAAPLPWQARGGEACARCRDDKFAFVAVTTLGVYQGMLQDAILRMKQPQEEALTIALGGVLAERFLTRPAPRPDLAVPIPMHWTRRIVRGVNAAELLAETLARRLRIPHCPDLLNFRRRPHHQHSLSPTDRRLNMRGAFGVRKRYDIKGACVLVVDDVLTTGATAHAAAVALKHAGAAETTVAVTARGIGVS